MAMNATIYEVDFSKGKLVPVSSAGKENLPRGTILHLHGYNEPEYVIDCLKGPYEKTGFALRLYPKGWGVYTGAIQHVSKRNVFAMLDWLHEQQAKPRKDLFNPKEVLYDQNRSNNAGL